MPRHPLLRRVPHAAAPEPACPPMQHKPSLLSDPLRCGASRHGARATCAACSALISPSRSRIRAANSAGAPPGAPAAARASRSLRLAFRSTSSCCRSSSACRARAPRLNPQSHAPAHTTTRALPRALTKSQLMPRQKSTHDLLGGGARGWPGAVEPRGLLRRKEEQRLQRRIAQRRPREQRLHVREVGSVAHHLAGAVARSVK